jgi:hypothetical protein
MAGASLQAPRSASSITAAHREKHPIPRTPGFARSCWSGPGQPPTGKPWPKVQMIEAAGGQIAAQNSASAGDTHSAKVMCSLTPLLWVMSPTTFHLTPRRPACRQSACGGKAGSRQACCVPLRSCRSGLEGMVVSSRWFSLVTRAGQPDCLAQVWMDHICLRPLAGSRFRLTLNEGAEPSLGTPGPE